MSFASKQVVFGGLLFAGVFLFSMVIVLRTPGWRPADQLIRRFRGEVEAANDSNLLPKMRRLVRVRDLGVVETVAYLGDSRERIASAARSALFEELERWRLLTPDDATRRIAHLAKTLAEAREQFTPLARQDAAELATQMLMWPLDQDSDVSGDVIAHCETLLRNATPRPLTIAAAPSNSAREAKAETPSRPFVEPTSAVVATPGGDVPYEVLNLPSLPAPVVPENQPMRSRSDEEPFYLELGRERLKPVSPPPGRLNPPATADPVPPPEEARREDESSRENETVRPVGIQPILLLAQQADLDVMRMLHSQDAEVSRRAVRELERRCFREEHIQLARQLTSPLEQDRLEFTEGLPERAGVDVRPWLLWLTLDESQKVRAAAVGLMATSSDPQLLGRVREMSRTERDPAILRVIGQVLSR